ncbi:TetR/AcrR family transcriptional regulator [Nocardia sp. BMG111209]|uniref:TetR/AcrR family transcriptional regulator n=1 Tax=Nocardia sp. BMG111209 TaxID=1160137 RepID=UPI00037BEA3F|nr:TetR family transcriptional regulator [Nocardia sp. BMG111209]
MPRWDPRAEERLREAALELYSERGYEHVTVAEITERAGLTRRTFFRYFTDKRDVLFAGSDRLGPTLAAAVLRADAALSPFEAVLSGLVQVGDLLTEQGSSIAVQRRAIVRSSPELQERSRTKFAAVADSLVDALERRGAPAAEARLLTEVGVALFREAFERWTDAPGPARFADHVHEVSAELAAHLRVADPHVPGGG